MERCCIYRTIYNLKDENIVAGRRKEGMIHY